MFQVRCNEKTVHTMVGSGVVVFGLFLLVCIGEAFAFGGQANHQENFTNEYRLSSQDKLRVRAYEWRVGGYEEWRALSGEFVVDVSGSLFLPLVGRVRAKNRTTEQLAKHVAEILKKRAGLKTLPDVSIEIIEYRPVYILGAVQRPGEFPYRPGLTTMKAVAIAGGLFRESAQVSGNQKMQQIRAEGRLQRAQMKLRRAYIKRARLNAERNWIEKDSDSLPVLSLPVEVGKTRQNNLWLKDEMHILTIRLSGLREKVKHLSTLSKLLFREKKTIEKKMAIQKKQVKLASSGERRADNLKRKHILSSNKWMQAKRFSLESQNSELDVNSALLRIKLERQRVVREISEERYKLLEQVATDMLEVKSRINAIQSTIAEEKSYLESVILSGGAMGLKSRYFEKTVTIYTIKRFNQVTDLEETFTASENTRMRPGDIVQIGRAVADESEGKAVQGAKTQ